MTFCTAIFLTSIKSNISIISPHKMVLILIQIRWYSYQTATPKSRRALLSDVFLSVLSFRFPIIRAQDTW